MKLVDRLLRRNTSWARVAGFVVSNFIGLAIVTGARQFYLDARGLWEADDSFISTDYLVVNKRVTGGDVLGGDNTRFSAAEIDDLRAQPWVRKVGLFTSNDFRAYMSVSGASHSLSSYIFFESIPDSFVDVPSARWQWEPGADVPIIISKDYLTLYNFGFASSAGMPQMSEGIMSGIPIRLSLRSEDGRVEKTVNAHVAGYSNRLNTILVPESFLREANAEMGTGSRQAPSRLIVDVSSPGDVAIDRYMEEHGLEVAGDKSASQASFLLRLVTAIVLAIGAVITLLSLFILVLSISLIMEKNRDKLHTLLMLGYDLPAVGRPYIRLAVAASVSAFLLATGAAFVMRSYYLGPLEGLGVGDGPVWVAPAAGLGLTLVVIVFNILAVRRRVLSAWRL